MLNSLKKKVISWLRWSEQYTKTDMVYLFKSGGWVTAGKIISILGGIVLVTAFANLIPQETYGTYKFVVSVASIIGGFTLSGMGTAVTQSVARGYEGSLKYGLKKKLKWNIGIFIAGFAAAGYYYIKGNMVLTASMLMIAAFYPLRTSFDLFSNFLQGKKNFKCDSIYHAIIEVVQVVIMIFTLFITNNVLWVLLAFFVTNTFFAIFFYFYTSYKHNPGDEKDENMLTYSKHLSFLKIFDKVATHIDKVVIFHYLGAVQLAIYSFAILPVSKTRTLLSSIQQVAFPKLSKKKWSTLQGTLGYKVGLFALFNLFLAFLFYLLAPILYDTIFPEYSQSIFYAQVFSFSIVLFAARMFEKAIEAKANTQWLYIIRVGSKILRIVSMIVIIPIFGIWGALSAIAVTKLIRAILSYIGFRTAKKD